ncbi:hypothetical protein N0V82_005677 [Gnomoniopsis sp. IMI 355080]|nr:hypothetical protein N0V82_005677 [Gnomoniopsis sp. IMI 355080]
MQPFNSTDVMDSDGQAPLPSLIPASSQTVLPHDSIEFTQLAGQASHLTLATSPGRADASSATGPQDGVPRSSRSRNRTCSACSSAAGDVDGLRLSPPLPRRQQASASSIARSPSRPATVNDGRLPNDAQRAPPISHEHAREETHMTAAAELELERHRMQPADALSLVAVWRPDLAQPWPSQKAGKDAPLATLANLPNEVLLHVLGYLDVCDLLLLSRTSHQFRSLALSPIIHRHRLRHARAILPPLLTSPSRPSLSELIARRVFLTNTTVVSRKLARSLTAIRLSRRLAVRPPPEALVARSVLPGEYVHGRVAPALVAKTRAVERERVKDGLRRWVGSVWERRWRETMEERKRGEESRGVGRVWRLRRFWERVGRGEVEAR